MSIDKLYIKDLLLPKQAAKRCVLPDKVVVEGNEVYRLVHNCDNILDRNIHIIAAPNQGKTTLLKSIMESIRIIRPIVILVAPTNTLDGYLPDFMWMRPAPGKLKALLLDINKFQAMMARIYMKSKDLSNMTAIAVKLQLDKLGISDHIIRLNETYTSERYNLSYEKCLISIIRVFIRQIPLMRIKKMLNDTEYRIIRFMDKKPNMLLIFDDMGADMQYSKEYENISTNYRHLFITMVTILHHGSFISNRARNCATYRITRYSSDLLWMMNNDSGCANKHTKEYIELYGDIIATYKKDNRFFLVLSAELKHRDLWLMFTAKEYDVTGPYYICSDAALISLITSKSTSVLDKCHYIYQGILNSKIK